MMLVYIGCFLTTLIYGLILSTRIGRKFTDKQTWATVVLGVVIIVGWIAVVDMDAATLTAKMFLAGCGPIIARSLILDFLRNEADVKRIIGE
jgi:hypothetical protein